MTKQVNQNLQLKNLPKSLTSPSPEALQLLKSLTKAMVILYLVGFKYTPFTSFRNLKLEDRGLSFSEKATDMLLLAVRNKKVWFSVCPSYGKHFKIGSMYLRNASNQIQLIWKS